MNEQNPVDLAALDRLADLYRDGLITREEFEKAKAALFPAGAQPQVPEVTVPEPPAPPLAEQVAREPKKVDIQVPTAAPVGVPPPQVEPPRSSSGLRRIDVSDRPTPPSKPKKSVAPYLAMAGGLLAVCCIFGFIIFRLLFSDGEPTQEETSNASPPVSTPTPYVPEDDPVFVAEFDGKIAEIEGLRETYDSRIAACKFADSLNSTWLATKTGRSKARTSIDTAQKYSEEFQDASFSCLTQAATMYKTKTGKPLINQEELTKMLSETRLEYRKYFDLHRKVVGYAESYRPIRSKKDGVLLFNTSRQVKNYNGTIDALNKQGKRLEALEKTLITRIKLDKSS